MTVPMMLDRLLIVGAGGSGREIAWLAREIHGESISLGFAVERQYLDTASIDGIPVVALDAIPESFTHYVVAIGDPLQRRRIASSCELKGLLPATLIHPGVQKSSRVTIGVGTIICAGSILTTNVKIGAHVHVNISCALSHDVIVDDFSTISPGVNIAGNVHVEENVFIGIGASIINGVTNNPLVMGLGATIAAGACVIASVDAGALVAGVPAVRKR